MPKVAREKKNVRVNPIAKPSVYNTGVKWKGRGPFKCVKNEGVSCKGVHPALQKAFWPLWDWEKAKASGTLTEIPLPAADKFVAVPLEARDRRLPYCKMQGIRFDNEITKTVKLSRTHSLPALFWFNKGNRALILSKLKGNTKAAASRLTSLRNAVKTIMPETMSFWKLMHEAKLTPVETQTPVARGRLGTKLDVLCTHALHPDMYRVIECKHGCEHNWTMRGLPLLPSAITGPERRVTSHNQHLLQTYANHLLFKATFPDRKTVKPWLVRVDRQGAHLYVAPEQPALTTLMT